MCVFDKQRTVFWNQLEDVGINVVGLSNSPYSFMNVIRLFPIMNRFDIVHSHNTSGQLLSVCLIVVANLNFADGTLGSVGIRLVMQGLVGLQDFGQLFEALAFEALAKLWILRNFVHLIAAQDTLHIKS